MAAPLAYLLEVQGGAEAAGELDNFEGRLDRTSDAAEKTTTSTQSLTSAMGQAGLGITTAATGAFSLYEQFDHLEKMELRIASASKNVDSAHRGAIEAQRALDALTTKGITTGAEYESAILRVSTAKQQEEIATDKLTIAQGDLSQSQVQFALSILPTLQGAITGAQSAMTAFRTIKVLTSAASVQEAVTTITSAGAHITYAGATGAAAAGTGGLSIAMKLLQLAMGPVGWIILGVSTFLALFATNAFGVRDAVNWMGKAIGDAIPVLRPLLDTLKAIADTIFPHTEDASKKTGDQVSSDAQKLAEEFNKTGSQANMMSTDLTASFSSASINGSKSFDQLAGNISKGADNIVSSANRAKEAVRDLSSFGGPMGGIGAGSTVAPAPSIGGGASNITVIINLDGTEIARKIGSTQGDILKFT